MQNCDEFEVFTKSGTSGSLTLIVKKKTNQSALSSNDRFLVGMSQHDLKCKQTVPTTASYPRTGKKKCRRGFPLTSKLRVIRGSLFPLGRYDDSCRSHTRPEISYEALIQMAFADMNEKHNMKFLRVCEIADWLREKFPYFCTLKYLPQCITFRLVSSGLFQKLHIGGRTVWSHCARAKAVKHLKRSHRQVHPCANRAVSTKSANTAQCTTSPRLPRIRKKPDFFSIKWNSRKRKSVLDSKHRYLKPRPKESAFPVTSEEKQEWKAHLEYLENVHSVVKPLTPETDRSSGLKVSSTRKSAQKLVSYLAGCNLNEAGDSTSKASDIPCDEFSKHCMFAYLGLASMNTVLGDVAKHTKMMDNSSRHEGSSRRSLTYDDNEDNTAVAAAEEKSQCSSESYGPPQLDATVTLGLDTSDEDVNKGHRFGDTAQKRPLLHAASSCVSIENHNRLMMSPVAKVESPKHSSVDLQKPLAKEVTNWRNLTKLPVTLKQETIDNNTAFPRTLVKSKKKSLPIKVEVKSRGATQTSGRINDGSCPIVSVVSDVSPHLPTVQSVFSLRSGCSLPKANSTSRQNPIENHAFLVPNNVLSDLHPSCGFCHQGVLYQPEDIGFPLSEFVPPCLIPNPFMRYEDKAGASLESYSEPTWTRDVKKSVMTTVVPAYCYVYPLPVVEPLYPSTNNFPYFEQYGHRVYRSKFFR